MDPTKNPFAPGAGNQPPELAGRDAIIEEARVALARIKAGTHDRGHLLLGLRGVGKTVLLNRINELALNEQFETMLVEARSTGKLVDLLVPRLRTILVQLSRREWARDYARRGLAVLRSFASAFKVSVGDVGFGVEAANGSADSGNLEVDLPELFEVVATAARASGTGTAILIDEVQYLARPELSALIQAVHQMSQRGLPLVLFGAGLPQLAGLSGDAKSYAERLFRFPKVGPLESGAAGDAIRKPIENAGAAIDPGALDLIVQQTQGFPYFLQEWGYYAWRTAERSPIKLTDVRHSALEARRNLDEAFFNVRFGRLTPRERDYLRAMATLGPGPSRSGDIAAAMHVEVTAASSLRTALIRKGMVYQSDYGMTAFTVPMFDDFMLRVMPNWSPRAESFED